MRRKTEHITTRLTVAQLEKLEHIMKALGANRNDAVCKLIENAQVKPAEINVEIDAEEVLA